MAIPSGLGAQLGIAEESTYGTPVTVTRFYEFLTESLALDIGRISSAALRTGTFMTRSDRWVAGGRMVGGDISMEIANKSFGLWLKHCLGSVATAGPTSTSVYTHTFTPGVLPTGLTVQVGRPSNEGTARAFTYHGCKVASFEIGGGLDEIPHLNVSLTGEDEDTATSLATASYPSSLNLFSSMAGTFTLAGAAFNIASFTLSGEHPLSDKRRIGSGLRGEPKENAFHVYSGTVDAEFPDLTHYNRFVNGTEAQLIAEFTGGAIPSSSPSTNYALRVTANIRTDGSTPTVGGPDEIRQPLSFVVTDTTVANNFKIEYITADTTP